MATAALLGKALAPRIARMHELTLYKVDRSRHYPNLDPILDGPVKPHLVRRARDETVRVIASIYARTASPSLILHRLGSYARQHSVHQALNEIGRWNSDETSSPESALKTQKLPSISAAACCRYWWPGPSPMDNSPTRFQKNQPTLEH